MRLLGGILLSAVFGVGAYAVLAQTIQPQYQSKSLPYDAPTAPALPDGVQGEEGRLIRTQSDVINTLTRRVESLEQRVDSLERQMHDVARHVR
jgi:TolA-binding protein